mgnify:CR=1 FL=1
MQSIAIAKQLSYTADTVWEKWDDVSGIYKFHPLIKRSPITSKELSGLGTQRVCYFEDGNELTEQVIKYNADERSMSLSINADFMPIKNASADIIVTSLGGTLAQVDFRMNFDAKFGIFGLILAKIVMKPKIKGMLNQLLDGLDTHLASGEVVGAQY